MATSCVAERATVATSSGQKSPASASRSKSPSTPISAASPSRQPAIHALRLPQRSTAGAQRNLKVQGKLAAVTSPTSTRPAPWVRRYTGSASLTRPNGKPEAKAIAAIQPNGARGRASATGAPVGVDEIRDGHGADA